MLVSPQANLVANCISKLSKDVSDTATHHLAVLLPSGRRYHITEGWRRWLESMTDKLPGHGDSIGQLATAEDWLARFEDGECNERMLWKGLCSLASSQDIAEPERRELFWGALSWQAQQRLAEQCEYFDPRNEIWTKGNSEDLARVTQKMDRVMRVCEWDDIVADHESKTRLRGWILAALSTTALALTIVAVGTHGHTNLCFASSLYSALFWMLSLFCAFFYYDSLQCLRRSRLKQLECFESQA